MKALATVLMLGVLLALAFQPHRVEILPPVYTVTCTMGSRDYIYPGLAKTEFTHTAYYTLVGKVTFYGYPCTVEQTP